MTDITWFGARERTTVYEHVVTCTGGIAASTTHGVENKRCYDIQMRVYRRRESLLQQDWCSAIVVWS